MIPMLSLQRSIVPSNLLPSWPRSDKRSVCEPYVLMRYRQEFWGCQSAIVLFSPKKKRKSAPLHLSVQYELIEHYNSSNICAWNLFHFFCCSSNCHFWPKVPKIQGAKMWTNNLPPGRSTWHKTLADENFNLVGGWTNPSEKYAQVKIGFIFPQFSGWKYKKYLKPPPS